MTDEFRNRFVNWVRWCRGRDGAHRVAFVSVDGDLVSSEGRALSIEGDFREKRRVDDTPTGYGDWLESAPVQIRAAVNVPDAVLVNRAYLRLAMHADRQARIIRILTFKNHWRPKWQAQKLGIHYLELGEAYYRACLMLSNQVDFLEKQAHSAPTVKPVYVTL